jgi:hypothetical protein
MPNVVRTQTPIDYWAKDSGYRSDTQIMVGFVLRWIHSTCTVRTVDRSATSAATIDSVCRLVVPVLVLFASFRTIVGV